MRHSNAYRLLKKIARTPFEGLVPFAIVAIVFFTVSNINLGKDYKNGIIEADGKGYYAYLPAVFIYHDLSFGFFYTIEREKYYNPSHYYTYLRLVDNHVVNKYYAGTALCMAPFFLTGHIIALVTGAETDGYSWIYTFFTHLGALFYLLTGLIFLQKILKQYHVFRFNNSVVLTAITFGTSLYYYSLVEFSMSHVYSFAAITAFIYHVKIFSLKPSGSRVLGIGSLMGIIMLIRPVNSIVFLAVPFIAGSWSSLQNNLQFLYRHPLWLILSISAFGLVIAVQFLIYYIQTGSIWVYSYPGEGFNFMNPHFIEFLFSYRKGLFLYTPLLLISLGGFFFLYRTSAFQAASLAFFLLILIYVLSSWHMWYYGGSFGQRVIIDFYAFFAILLGVLLKNITGKILKPFMLTLIVLVTLFCQVQTYQYRYHQIHWSDMDREQYWHVFLRIDRLMQ